MAFLDEIPSSGHIDEAIAHYNSSLEKAGDNSSKVEICQSLFNCLNKIQTEWLQWKGLSLRESEGFSKMIQNLLKDNPASTDFFLKSNEFFKFSQLNPPILDHLVLRQGNYRPNQEIPQDLVNKASKQHQNLKLYVTKYHNNEIAPDEVLRQTSRVLYIVRSNIAHGEKTPYGPDLRKVERDSIVSGVTIPVQFLLIDLLLGKPHQKFVSYGTLGPHGSNHTILSQLPGLWQKCSIRGFIESDESGLLFFTWDLSREFIDAQLFTSENLPGKWAELDRFEGIRYKRRLIPVQRTDGKICIANIFVRNQAL